MDGEDTLKTAKEGFDVAKEVTGKLDDWAEEADKLAKAGEDLNKVQTLLQGVTAFGKLSAGLGVASAGLGIILGFVGGPSPEEQIMNMISKLSGKIDTLSHHIDDAFDRLTAHGDKVNAGDLALGPTDLLRDLRQHIADLTHPVNAGDRDALEQVFLADKYRPGNIEDQVMHLVRRLTSDDPAENILKALNAATRGDAPQVLGCGLGIVSLAVFAPLAYAAVNAARHKNDPSEDLMSATGIAALFDGQIAALRDAVAAEVQDCHARADANIEDKVRKDIVPKLDVSDYQKAADAMMAQLQDHWPWMRFAVIVYAPVEGFDNHGVVGGAHRLDLFRSTCLDGASANIIVAWTDGASPPGRLVTDYVVRIATHYPRFETALLSVEDFEKARYPNPTFIGISQISGEGTEVMSQNDSRAFLDDFEAQGYGTSLLFLLRNSFMGVPLHKSWGSAISRNVTSMAMRNNWDTLNDEEKAGGADRIAHPYAYYLARL
ncbi:hypothetical protein [Anianabacter salinae]|uniref:hypothetical protein n=1 Tax=Anianabacter salinae TaxID=2851023 RepID=UPI00225E13FF|nr:hypothetical protein [Anianabacter salinae]MBV0912124.1 hypothetical protein [Anianabacter salinae]